MNASHPDKPPRRRYPSDISDRTWGRMARQLPAYPPRGRKRSTDVREVVNGINYRWTTGCTWRMLPHDFPPWETIYGYFRRWMRDGTLRQLREILIRPHRSTAADVAEREVAPHSHHESPERADLRIWSPDDVSNPERSRDAKLPSAIEPPPDVA